MNDEHKGMVKTIFLKVFDSLKAEEFDFAKKSDQYANWDSFSHMQLISEAEAVFKVTLEMDEISQIDSAEKLLEIVSKKLPQ